MGLKGTFIRLVSRVVGFIISRAIVTIGSYRVLSFSYVLLDNSTTSLEALAFDLLRALDFFRSCTSDGSIVLLLVATRDLLRQTSLTTSFSSSVFAIRFKLRFGPILNLMYYKYKAILTRSYRDIKGEINISVLVGCF